MYKVTYKRFDTFPVAGYTLKQVVNKGEFTTETWEEMLLIIKELPGRPCDYEIEYEVL